MTRIDTQYAASVLQRPVFPSFRATEPYLKKLYRGLNSTTREKLDTLERDCQGFAFLKTSKNGKALLQIVYRTWSMLECYDFHTRNPNCGIEFNDIVTLRRLLQHAAISSEPSTDILHELSRLAIIAFTTDCLSPLYPGGVFHRNSARAIKMAVVKCINSGYFQLHSELMLWVLVLGGYIARETPLRLWYIQQLHNTPILPSRAGWALVQRISEQHLPFRFEPGRKCQEFWNEACMWTSHG
jgi:hypothetical protein